MEIVGTVVYNDFEGGFWGIVDDDGKKYAPSEEFTPELRLEGLRVRAVVQPAAGFSTRMWGRNVQIVKIEKFEG